MKLLTKLLSLFKRPEPDTGKFFIHFSDGLCTLADSQHEAEALVLQRCLESEEPVFANFYKASAEDVAEYEKLLAETPIIPEP